MDFFKTVFSSKSAKAWVSVGTVMLGWYFGIPMEYVAPITGAMTWMVPNG